MKLDALSEKLLREYKTESIDCAFKKAYVNNEEDDIKLFLDNDANFDDEIKKEFDGLRNKVVKKKTELSTKCTQEISFPNIISNNLLITNTVEETQELINEKNQELRLLKEERKNYEKDLDNIKTYEEYNVIEKKMQDIINKEIELLKDIDLLKQRCNLES